ncbi:unnamed protein product [Prorocentrum cordatum]|uniref:Uncharacterized protein n=1 Tax=Prorocentrum cordatum TaxID=2364126 RepID=A0ABN9Q600_9DINO|nr:unnamed protein product [Polarella glacialis]
MADKGCAATAGPPHYLALAGGPRNRDEQSHERAPKQRRQKAGPVHPAATVEGTDSGDETAAEVMRGYLNTAQRQRALESCLSTHFMPHEHQLNYATIGAAQKYSDTVKEEPTDHGLGPPSPQVGLAALETISTQEVLRQRKAHLVEHLKSLEALTHQLKVSHTMSGPALLRLSDRTSSPRQGPLVVTGRRLSRKRGAVPVTTVGQVLLLSGRALSAKKKWSGWACSPAAPQASTERPSAGAGAGAAPEAARLVEFEALHAFSHRLDTSGAIASLPLLRCSAGAVEECADGSGWRLRVSEDDCDEEVADAAGAPACSAGCQSAGASLQERNGWTLIFNSRDSCEEWQRAIRIACSAAKAQEAGRRRTHEEALAEYDADPEAWRRGALRRLTEAEQSAASASAPAGLRMVIRACDEAWSDARDLLDGALQQRPWHRDACEAVLEAALGPSGACAGRAWARWSGELSQNDGRTLLRWLDARRAAAHRMGVVYPALNAAIAGLSAELSLRTGEHLRRMSASLLGKELGVAARPRQAQLLGASSGASFTVPAASTLPVDLFALVCSCFPEAEDKEPVELLLSSRRVARFVIFEVQGALYRWLLETHQQIAEDVLGGRGPAAGSRERAKPLPPGVWAWLERVAALTRDIPGFQEQCTQWSARLSDAESSSSGMSRQPCADDRDELGRTALPLEWSLGPEAERFAELEGTLLWAACDVASLEWRRRALSETAAHGLKSLQDHLDGPLQGLRGMLEAAQFESLLRKLFHVCLAALVLRLSRRQCSQGATAMAVARQEAEYLCSYFQSQAARAVLAGAADAPPPPPPLEGGADLAEAGAPWGQPPWEFAMVAQVLQVVTESAMSSRRQSRSSGGSTPTGRITPGGPGTPGGAMDARSPGSAHAGAELRGGSLPSTQGLGQLVRVVQPERQLPLAELAAWFGDGPAGLRGCFEELPPSDGFGGAYLPPRAEDGPAGSRTPPRSPVQSMPPVIRSASWNSNDSRRRSSLIGASSAGPPPGRPCCWSPPGPGRRSRPGAWGRSGGGRCWRREGSCASCAWRRRGPTAPSAAWACGHRPRRASAGHRPRRPRGCAGGRSSPARGTAARRSSRCSSAGPRGRRWCWLILQAGRAEGGRAAQHHGAGAHLRPRAAGGARGELHVRRARRRAQAVRGEVRLPFAPVPVAPGPRGVVAAASGGGAPQGASPRGGADQRGRARGGGLRARRVPAGPAHLRGAGGAPRRPVEQREDQAAGRCPALVVERWREASASSGAA